MFIIGNYYIIGAHSSEPEKQVRLDAQHEHFQLSLQIISIHMLETFGKCLSNMEFDLVEEILLYYSNGYGWSKLWLVLPEIPVKPKFIFFFTSLVVQAIVFAVEILNGGFHFYYSASQVLLYIDRNILWYNIYL